MCIHDITQTRHRTATETHNLCTNMHTHAYKHLYTCICILIHIHMYLHTYLHVHTYTYIHIYTHTYNMYICTHTSTPGTTAPQQLHAKPDLTLRKLRTSPLEVVVPPPFDDIHLTRNDVSAEINTTNSSSSHHHDSAPPSLQLLICTGAEPIHTVHGPSKLRATESCSKNRFDIVAIFPGF